MDVNLVSRSKVELFRTSAALIYMRHHFIILDSFGGEGSRYPVILSYLFYAFDNMVLDNIEHFGILCGFTKNFFLVSSFFRPRDRAK